MKKWKMILCGIALLALTFIVNQENVLETYAADELTLLDVYSSWKYYDKETDPVGDGERTAWTEKDFDVSDWKETTEGEEAKFGAKKGKLAEVNSIMPTILLNQYKEGTTKNIEAFFFRTEINVENVEQYEGLYLIGEILYDDAALVYLNGELIGEFSSVKYSTNMQYGGHGGAGETGIFAVPSSELQEGENIIAVEIHQVSESSSDIYFQMNSLVLGEYVTNQKSIALTVGEDETSRNITWYCNMKTSGTVQYAKKQGADFPGKYKEVDAEMAVTDNVGNYSYKATMTDLEKDTEYVYRLTNGDYISDVYSFRTTGNGGFSFFAVGDPQIGASSTSTDAKNWATTLEKAKEIYPEAAFLISAGDQVNSAGSESQYEAFLEQMTNSELPVATSIGNHDSSSEIYSQHYNHPNVTSYGESDAGTDYWFVYNDVLFMHLNSNSGSIAEHRAFIKEAIEKNEGVDWKIVTFHHSIYSAASHASQNSILTRRENYVPIFEEFDIDLVIMGHDHVYVRSYIMDGFSPIVTEEVENSVVNPQGILYMTLNSGSGSKYYSISGQYEYAAVQSQEKIPTISCITVDDNNLKITTHRVDATMSILDEFSILRKQTIEDMNVKLSYTKCTYSGNLKRPKVTIDGLKNGTDYEVTYKNNKNPGKATVTIKGIGNYMGTVTKEFTIVPKATTSVTAKLAGHDDVTVTWKKVTGASGYKIYYKRTVSSKYIYAGRTTKLSLKQENLRDGYKYIFKVVPYVVIDGERVNGAAKTKSVYTLAKMKTPTISRTQNRLKVKWKKMNGSSGYQISRSSKKTGTYIVATIKGNNTLSANIKATKGKRYYIKVRAYTLVDGKRVVGPWSQVKSYVR